MKLRLIAVALPLIASVLAGCSDSSISGTYVSQNSAIVEFAELHGLDHSFAFDLTSQLHSI